jgi:hypothetical protein
MTDPGSQRSKRMPKNCPAEIADKKPSRRQFVDLKLIDHAKDIEQWQSQPIAMAFFTCFMLKSFFKIKKMY